MSLLGARISREQSADFRPGDRFTIVVEVMETCSTKTGTEYVVTPAGPLDRGENTMWRCKPEDEVRLEETVSDPKQL
jgi:hypothetical protein